MANLIGKIYTKLYQNWPRYVKRYDKNILVCFWFTVLTFAKRECCVSQGSVETLFRRGEKRMHYCMANLFRTILAKFY